MRTFPIARATTPAAVATLDAIAAWDHWLHEAGPRLRADLDAREPLGWQSLLLKAAIVAVLTGAAPFLRRRNLSAPDMHARLHHLAGEAITAFLRTEPPPRSANAASLFDPPVGTA